MSEDTTDEQSVNGTKVTREMRHIPGAGECRFYVTEDGGRYPSVSTVNDSRPNPGKKYALRNWRRKHDGFGNTEHYSDITKVKAHFGTLAHYYVLTPFTKRDLWGEEEAVAKQELQNHGQFRGVDAWTWALNRFMFVQRCFHQVLRDEDVTGILGVERYVLDQDHGYAGQYDLLYTRKGPDGDETVLCDLKTGSAIRHDYELQITAYANAVDVDVDALKIVRAHMDESDGEFEIHTESDFDSSREECLNEFTGYVRRFQRQTSRGPENFDQDSTSSSIVAEGSSTQSTQNDDTEDPTTIESSETSTDSDTDDTVDLLTQVDEAVEMYLGSPYGMGQMLRKAVDNNKVPQVIETEIGEIPAEERPRILEQLDKSLAAPGKNAKTDKTDSDRTDVVDEPSTSESTKSDDTAAKTSQQMNTDANSIDNMESAIVELSPAIAALLEWTVSSNDRFANSTEELVGTALEEFLVPTIGAELDPSRFTFTNDITVIVDCDPILSRLLELSVETNDQLESVDDFTTRSVMEHLGITEVETSLTLTRYYRYQMIIEALVSNETCPCETPDDVVQAALEGYLSV